MLSPEVLLQQGLEAGRSAASLFLAGVFHGLAAELALNPGQVWQEALRLLPPQQPLTLEQQQQQNRHILANALQQEYGEALNRLPAGTGSLGLLPAAELPETPEIYEVPVGIPVPMTHEIDLSEVNLDRPDLEPPSPAESPNP